MLRTAVAAALLVTLPAVAAAARETIVGRWGETPEACGTPSAIDIGPMRLASEETVCDFADVSRVGDVVTWRGICHVAEEPPRRETVVATLAADRSLTLRFRASGATIPGLRRCR